MANTIIGVVKFVAALILVPVLISTVGTFHEHLNRYSSMSSSFFIYGVWGFVITFCFLYQFWAFEDFGQKIMKAFFSFVGPLDELFASFIPFYTVMILLLFYVVRIFLRLEGMDPHYMFFAGFTFLMHVILTAQALLQQELSPIKPHYFLVITVIIIVNIFILILFLDLAYGQFTFPYYFDAFVAQSKKIYSIVFDKIPGLS